MVKVSPVPKTPMLPFVSGPVAPPKILSVSPSLRVIVVALSPSNFSAIEPPEPPELELLL